MSILLKKENRCLNFYKGVACILIVMLHTNISASSGLIMYLSSFINCLSRLAVPLFFMISGFYLYSDDRVKIQKKLPSKIKHILIISIVSIIIYAVFIILKNYVFKGISIIKFFNSFTFNDLYSFIIFNDIPKAMSDGLHLWFVFALLYCYIIMLLVNKFNLYKYAYIYIVIGFAVLFVLEYALSFTDSIKESYYRNFIVVGFPCFMLGNFIGKYKEKIINSAKLIFSKRFSFIMIFGGVLLALFERALILGASKVLKIDDVGHEVYFGSIITAVYIIIYSMKAPEKYYFKPIEYLGKYCSLDVYVIHNIIKCFYDLCFGYSKSNPPMQIVRILFTLTVSILLSVLFRLAVSKIKKIKSIKTA